MTYQNKLCSLTILSFLHPSVLDFVSGMEQTDGHTDNGHQCIMTPLYEAEA